jgi:L-fucose isomerase-like protein
VKTPYLIANGDLRLSANQKGQPAQAGMEAQVIAAFEKCGAKIQRAHAIDPKKGHGFIDSQKYGMEVFKSIPVDAPLVVAEAVWQYSHHVLHGLLTHKGPILTVANWSGTWPGLVGMLNLNGSMTKAGIRYSTLWSEDFKDEKFLNGLKSWLTSGAVQHDTSHARAFDPAKAPADAVKVGVAYASALKKEKRIMGVFDEGCMGMYNAIIPDELLHTTGIFKERLSQSALYATMQTVSDAEAGKVFDWYVKKGLKFQLGENEEADLTRRQVLQQCKMYIAAVRIADEFGCHTIGIQYQQGLKDLAPASDLVEGTLNNSDRPPVFGNDGRELYKGDALPHFNEVDECAGLDGLVTYELWKQLGEPPENTLHDVRWARHYKGPGQYADGREGVDDYVWVFEISGSAPPAHFINGWSGASSERQPAMYFRLGGGTLKGISKPGWVVWSRVYVEAGALKFDTGLAEVVKLPDAETQDRWNQTTSQWPIMHAVLKGVSRDQFMAKHKSNHIQCAYGHDKAGAIKALYAKAAAMRELGLAVNLCGDIA